MTDHTVSFTIKPYEILTLRLQMKGSQNKKQLLPDASVSIGKAAVFGNGKNPLASSYDSVEEQKSTLVAR